MKRILITTLVMLCTLSPAQGQTSQEASKELNEGAAAYKAGDFAAAQRHFERALELDSNSKNAPLFIARAIHAQYRPGVDTPENTAKAREAIEAYRKVLERNPDDDNAYNSVAYLYRQLKEEQKEEEWLMTRANLDSAPREKRSDAYTILASKQWNCSYDITERKENKQTVHLNPDSVVIQYKKPTIESDFYKAQQCATRGIELIEQAISLNPENPSAWSYKTSLLREMAKLAEMEGGADQKAHYNKLADEAEASHKKLHKGNAQDDQQGVMQLCATGEPVATPSRSDRGGGAEPAAAGKEVIVSAGVLNGKAISKPAPAYPPAAKEARASGDVTVQIVVDETGKVFSARPVGGHPLLGQASVNAACKARFSPTTLSGQPVKVSGVITYNFVLQ